MRPASSLQRTILYAKPYSQLLELIEVNPAFQVLSIDQDFWAEKAFLDFKVPRWYWSLTSELLSPPENYLYLLSQKGLIRESERVLDLNVCFSRAARMGNEELMDYFSSRMRRFGTEPEFRRAFNEALVGGHIQIVENLSHLVVLKRESALPLACLSGNIELVEYVLTFPSEPARSKLSFNLALVRSLTVSYEFYLQVKKLLGNQLIHILPQTISSIISTGSVESFEEIYPKITSNEAIEFALMGAFTSENPVLIEKVLDSFPIPSQLILRAQRKSFAHRNDVQQYAALARQSSISLDEFLKDAEIALENNSYSVLSLILASHKFGPAQTQGLDNLFYFASEKGDLGIVHYISQRVDNLQFFIDNLEFAVRSGSLPLARYFALKLANHFPLQGIRSGNFQSLEILKGVVQN